MGRHAWTVCLLGLLGANVFAGDSVNKKRPSSPREATAVQPAAAVRPAPEPPLAPTGSAPPPTPAAVETPAAPLRPRGVWASALVGPGFSLQGGPAALALSVRGAVEVARLGTTMPVEVVLPLYLTYASATGLGVTATSLGLMLVPAARLSIPLLPKASLYLELGLGLAHYRFSAPITFYGNVGGSATGLELTFVGGLQYLLQEQVALFVEPVGLHANTGGVMSITVGNQTQTVATGSGVTWSMLVGIAYRVPLSGQ